MANAILQARQSDVSHVYIDYLNEAVETFESAFVRLKHCESSPCDLSDAINEAHRIKGSAAMYGLPEIGLVAGKTEACLRGFTAGTDSTNSLISLVGLIDGIHEICQEKEESIKVESPPTPPTIKPVPSSGPQGRDLPRGRKRIVIAYEDIWISELMASLFGHDFSVAICQTGKETLLEIERRRPDLLIIESGFGGLDDLNFLKIIQSNKHAQDVPIFVTFEPNSPGLIAQALSLGVAGFSDDKHEVLDVVISAKSMLLNEAPRILIVDDDPLVRDLLSHVFKGAGMEVDTTKDGLDALDYLSKNTPDIILLDRFMPRLEGGTVLYEIKNKINLKSIPVLILTAMVNNGEAASWFERGAADFIPKPFDPDEVLMRVKQHLKKAQNVGSQSWA